MTAPATRPRYPGGLPLAFYSALWNDIVVSLAQGVYEGWRPTPAAQSTYGRPRPVTPAQTVPTGEMDLAVERYTRTATHRLVIGVDRVITATQYRRALAALPERQQARITAYLTSWPIGNARYPAMTDEQRSAWGSLASALDLTPTVLKETLIEARPETVTDLFTPTRARRRVP